MSGTRVGLRHTGEIVLDAPIAHVAGWLRDPLRWGALQPYVRSVVAEGEGVHRWEFDEMIVVGVRLRPQYRTRILPGGDGEIRWVSAEPGPYACEGAWRLESLGPTSTRVRVEVAFEADLDLPAPFVAIARPAVERQFGQQIDRLLANVAASAAGVRHG